MEKFFVIPERIREEIARLTGAPCPICIRLDDPVQIGSKKIRFVVKNGEVRDYWY